MFDGLFLILVDVELGFDIAVAFDQFGGGEPQGDVILLGVILDEVHHGMDAAMHGTVVVFLAAEILHHRRLLIFGHMDGMFDEFLNTLAVLGRTGDAGNAQQFLHLVHIDGTLVSGQFIHKVQGQHHRNVQFHELKCEIEVAFDVGGIDNINQRLGMGTENESPRNEFLAGIGRQAVDTGQVGHAGMVVLENGSALLFDGHAGEIAHMLVGARQLVEKRGLAGILVTHQCKRQPRPFGQGMFGFLVVIFTALAQTRVHDFILRLNLKFFFPGVTAVLHRIVKGHDFDARCIFQAQRQLVAVYLNLDGVTHRGIFNDSHLSLGQNTHVEKVLAQSALTPHFGNHSPTASWQLAEVQNLLIIH